MTQVNNLKREEMYYTDDNNDCIILKIVDRIDYMIIRHNKVLVMRFDAHFHDGYRHDGGNREISLLMKSLAEACHDQGIDCHYVWVRERASGSSNYHYHVVLVLDGNRIQNTHDLLKRADATWSNLLGGFANRLHFCTQVRSGKTVPGGVMIRRPSSTAAGREKINQEQEFQARRAEAVYMASYLAKNVTKEDQLPRRVRRYGSSEL